MASPLSLRTCRSLFCLCYCIFLSCFCLESQTVYHKLEYPNTLYEMKPSQSFFTLINIVLLQHVNNAHAIAPAWAGPQATVLGTTGLYMTSSPQITQAVDGISHLKNLLKRQADNAATCGFYQSKSSNHFRIKAD